MYYQSYRSAFSQGIWKGIQTSFQKGSSLTRLIYINIGIFLILKIASAIVLITGGNEKEFYLTLLQYLGLSADPYRFLDRPWTLITYMFTQFEFLHLLFNMLWLYWFGSFFLDSFNRRELTGVYLLGGIAGALLYFLAYSFSFLAPRMDYSWAIGSSACVMAIVFAVCTYLPHNRIYIFLLGPVKLIHLAIFTAVIDILSIPSGNAGGHIAHLGGALFGCIYAVGVKKHRNWLKPMAEAIDSLGKFFSFRRKKHFKYTQRADRMSDREYNAYKKKKDERINAILDKISRSGYESLSREEKEILFRSNK